MKRTASALLQAHEFAKRTGVTVRTLHHYDRLGLLKPAGYSEAGYRLYSEQDAARLQQIVMLKFIGFPLKQIKELLDRNIRDLSEALQVQRQIIEEERQRLTRALQAIGRAERAMAASDVFDWQAFKAIIEVIAMQSDWDWVKKYYSDQQLQKLGERWSPALQGRVDQDWAALIRDVEAALAEDPAGANGQALAQRWIGLIEQFTGGDPAIRANLQRLYQDEANWPAGVTKPYSDGVEAFIEKAIAARRTREDAE